jgi:hypothetical protein
LPDLIKIDPAIVNNGIIEPGNSTPVFVAVLLSLLVPKVPLISLVDTRLRKFLHRLAAIPYEAMRLSKEIQQAEYRVPDAMRTSLCHELEAQGFDRNEIRFDATDAITHRWLSIASLMQQLREWEQGNQFTAFVQDRAADYKRIKEHYGRLTQLAKNAFALEREAGAQPELEALRDAGSKFRTNLYHEEGALYAEICDFISHGVLKACFSFGARSNALQRMGFRNLRDKAQAGFSVNHTILLFGLLLVLMMMNFIMFSPADIDVERTLLKITMIVSIYSTAVVCAVLPKKRWSLFQYGGSGSYPAVAYCLSAMLAVFAGIGISLMFKTLIFAGSPEVNGFSSAFAKAWSNFTGIAYPWSVMSFVTAATTAFLIDWRQPQWLETRWRRLLEAGIQAAVLVAAAMLVHWWLSDLGSAAPGGARIPQLISLIRVTAVIGFVLGYFVPTWYRRAPDDRPAEAEAAVASADHAHCPIDLSRLPASKVEPSQA